MNKIKILVIEDDPDILDILSYLLTEEGYEVITSADGGIVNEVQVLMPDLVLLDEWLGNEKGSALCVKLKADPLTASIPVVMITALSDINEIVKKAGADGYVKKPFNIDEITTTINKFIRK